MKINITPKNINLKILYFVICLIMLSMDQYSKYWAMHALLPFEPWVITSFFNLNLAFNTGAAFSFLHNAGPWHQWLFLFINSTVSIVLIIGILRTATTSRLTLLGFSLVLSGALGNLIDRLTLGYVIDFIQVHYSFYYWPTFNIADSSICVGAAILLYDLNKKAM